MSACVFVCDPAAKQASRQTEGKTDRQRLLAVADSDQGIRWQGFTALGCLPFCAGKCVLLGETAGCE